MQIYPNNNRIPGFRFHSDMSIPVFSVSPTNITRDMCIPMLTSLGICVYPQQYGGRVLRTTLHSHITRDTSFHNISREIKHAELHIQA